MFPGGLEEGVEGDKLVDGIRRFLGERYVVCEQYVVGSNMLMWASSVFLAGGKFLARAMSGLSRFGVWFEQVRYGKRNSGASRSKCIRAGLSGVELV